MPWTSLTPPSAIDWEPLEGGWHGAFQSGAFQADAFQIDFWAPFPIPDATWVPLEP